jgi:hypothetical protein
MAELNITNIPAPRVPFIDERTGLMAREWYRFFLNLFVLTGSGGNQTSLDDVQLGPPNQPDLTELLIQINQNIAPQYEDQSGDFLATLDTAQLMSMMARFENAEAAIQGAYLQPVVQTGTIANYNLDGSPTAGGVAYGTGPALAVSAAGTVGQVLTSGGAGAPTWATDAGGSVTSVSVVSANGLAGTVATATSTPAITLSTTITGLLKGNGTAISAAASGTDYAPATSGSSILYGNATGGFNNVTIGTGVSFVAGTLSATGSGGTVTSVTGTAPVVSSGGTTPAISMPAATTSVNGYLTSTDWNTFNNKGSGTVTSVSGTAGRITSTGGATPVIDLVSGIATPGTTGSVSLIPVVTIDTYGRVTSITTAANPQGTVTSVSGTGTVNGITLTGTVTSSGSLTLGGTLSGTASGLTAGNVTTNANLTGPITSVGNATSVAAQTGTGSTFVMNTSPTLITPILGVAAATSINFGVSALTTYSESQSWTPNQGSGLTVVGAFSSSGTYTRVGNMITANGYVSGATSVAVAATGDLCSNLPVGAGGTTIFFGGAANNSISVFSQTLTSTQRLISLNAIGATPRIYFSVNYTV